MRIRSHEIDPVVGLMSLAVAVLGLVLGLGLWGVAAGLVILAAAGGSRVVAAGATRRFELPPVGTQERALVMRALGAAATMKRLVQSVPTGPVTNRSLEMERQGRVGLPTLPAPPPPGLPVQG